MRHLPRRIRFHAHSVLILLLCVCGRAEAKKIDSLRNVLSSAQTKDTSKVLAYAGMAWEYKNRNTDADSILFYANKGLELARAIDFKKGIALCTMHKGIANILRKEFSEAVINLDAALTYFEPEPPSKELNEIYHNIGLTYYMQTKFDPAIKYFDKSKKAALDIQNASRLARAHFYLGDIYNDMGNFANALQDYLKALELYEKGGNKNSASNCLTNIATVYAQLKDFRKAREFVGRSLQEFSHSTNPQEIYQNYANIGIVYSLMGEYDSALYLFDKGILLTDSMGDEYWKTVFLSNKAEVYTSSDKPDLAIAAYKQILARNEQTQEVNFTISAHSGMGRILYKQGKRHEGITHLEEALRLMKENGLKRLIMETYHDLSDIYEKEGNYRKALDYQRLYDIYEDSISSESTAAKMQQLQYDYELEKKQKQIAQLNKNKETQKEKSKQQEAISWSLAGAMVLLAVVIIVMYRSRLIEKKNKEEILRQHKEIQLQATKLEELNRFKDKTFSVLSHDLRGPINSITAAIQMLNNKEISPEEYAELKPEINNQLNSLNLLLDNVLLWAKSYIQEDKAAKPAPTNMHELVKQNVTFLKDAADRKQIKLVNNITNPVMALCDAGQINIVIRNLIMNAIKYTRKGGTITISIAAKPGTVSISVADTGVGIGKEELEQLFTTKTSRNTFGTEGEKGLGLGLLLCTEFVKANRGEITATSTLGKGSTFTMTLPGV